MRSAVQTKVLGDVEGNLIAIFKYVQCSSEVSISFPVSDEVCFGGRQANSKQTAAAAKIKRLKKRSKNNGPGISQLPIPHAKCKYYSYKDNWNVANQARTHTIPFADKCTRGSMHGIYRWEALWLCKFLDLLGSGWGYSATTSLGANQSCTPDTQHRTQTQFIYMRFVSAMCAYSNVFPFCMHNIGQPNPFAVISRLLKALLKAIVYSSLDSSKYLRRDSSKYLRR